MCDEREEMGEPRSPKHQRTRGEMEGLLIEGIGASEEKEWGSRRGAGGRGRVSCPAMEGLLNVKRCVKLIAGEACAVC